MIVEPFNPTCRIIVKADRTAVPANVDVMREREIAEAEVEGDLAQRFYQLFLTLELADVADERFYPIEHPPLRWWEGVPSCL